MGHRGLAGFLVVLFGPAVGLIRAEDPVRLSENFYIGYHYHVSSRVELSGRLTLPAEKNQTQPRKLPVTGKSALEYDERILARDRDGTISRTIRFYERMNFERKVGEQHQQNSLRAEVRRLVLLRHKQMEVPFAPAGPLTWGEIDMVRTDVFTPALAGLFPDRAVRPGDTWQASSAAVQELTDLERIDEGSLTCKLESIIRLGKHSQARVSLLGTVRGLGEDGPTRHQLDGFGFFDLEANHLSYLSLKGVQFLLDKDHKPLGKIEGTFVLTRQPYAPCKELTDEALRGLTLEPNEENTLLLHDNPELGIRFLYPRRWRVAGTTGRQIGVDEARGKAGLLLTVETLANLPSGAQYLQESRTWLDKQKAVLFKTEPPRLLQGPPQSLEYFTIEAQAAGQRVHLDYYVLRQPLGGVTLAARLPAKDLEALRRDVLRMVRSIQITRKQ